MFFLLFFFFSIDKVSKVASPVLVIHGTEDEVIDFSHGLAIYERCPRAVEPLWVEGAGHNDIELYAQYLERLKQFISFELATSWKAHCSTLYNTTAHTAMSSSQLFTHRAEDQRRGFALADKFWTPCFCVYGGIKEQGLSISANRKRLFWILLSQIFFILDSFLLDEEKCKSAPHTLDIKCFCFV